VFEMASKGRQRVSATYMIVRNIVVINVRKKIKKVNKRVFYEKNKKRL